MLIIALLSKTKNFFVAGLVPLFPTFALIALPAPEGRSMTTTFTQPMSPLSRRQVLLTAALLAAGRTAAAQAHPDRHWYEVAEAMRRRAIGAGDQPYGAVLVTAGGVVAEGPSRVIEKADPDAHAEREAIREAQRLTGTLDLGGAVLYSTSRPCRACEQAAAKANVSRMYFGPQLVDAGVPRP